MNIPNLPFGKIIEETGNPTDSELTFRQNIVSELQNHVGPYGFDFPQLTATEIATLEAATIPNPTGVGVLYLTPFGRGVYNSTANSIMFAVDNGAGAPLFKTVTLT